VFIPLGYWLGIKQVKPIKLEANPGLEAAYKQNKNIDKETAQVGASLQFNVQCTNNSLKVLTYDLCYHDDQAIQIL